jgi:uncharacterized membrane protein SirB2
MSEKRIAVIALFKQRENERSFNGGENIVTSRFYPVLICAVVVIFAAFMNYRQAVSASWTNYLMFIGAIGMFVCAGLLYKSEKP